MKPKRWQRERPTKKAALAAFNSQRPLDAQEREPPKRTRRKLVDDGIGATDLDARIGPTDRRDWLAARHYKPGMVIRGCPPNNEHGRRAGDVQRAYGIGGTDDKDHR